MYLDSVNQSINQSINQGFRDVLLSTYQTWDELAKSRKRYGPTACTRCLRFNDLITQGAFLEINQWQVKNTKLNFRVKRWKHTFQCFLDESSDHFFQ